MENIPKDIHLSSIVNKIATNINPDKIYLFSSYSIGQANEDSDIDLLVIKDTDEPKYKRSIEIQRLLIGTKLPVDVIVYTLVFKTHFLVV